MPRHLRTKPRHTAAADLCSPYDWLAGDVDAFTLPLYRLMGDGPMFVAAALGELDVERLLAAYRGKVWRGMATDDRQPRRRWRTRHRRLIFRLGQACFLLVDSQSSCCRVFARDPDRAEALAREVADRFRARRRAPRPVPVFHLLSAASNGVAAQEVRLADAPKLTPADLALLYGDDFPAWDAELGRTLLAPASGTVILRGPPGTGKTSYLRHLVAKLGAAAHFYFLPSSLAADLLVSPRLVRFWADEAKAYPKTARIVILEDSEDLIAERADQTRGQVADLLQVSSGFLADFMQLKVICTVNCPVEKLDPAIVRSGRLLAAKQFSRLPKERALLVAERYRLVLADQEEYSLAEIFCGASKMSANTDRPPMGYRAL